MPEPVLERSRPEAEPLAALAAHLGHAPVCADLAGDGGAAAG